MDALKRVTIYTDGACLGNPGPGGYGVVLSFGARRRELSAGYRKTTNNRMELLAATVGLQALKERCHVLLYSDSKYLVTAMTEGWARRWESNGWKLSGKGRAANPDLWEALLRVAGAHDVAFLWTKGHAGDPENERCDHLASQAAREVAVLVDEVYERSDSDSDVAGLHVGV